MSQQLSIVWYRQDLRISDHPPLWEAAQRGKILPIYICDPLTLGEASKIFLHHSLHSLNHSLKNCLHVYKNDPLAVFSQLVKDYKIDHLYFNLSYEPWIIKETKAVVAFCKTKGIEWTAFNANFLYHPSTLTKEDGTFYRVFTPFKKNALKKPFRKPISTPKKLDLIKDLKHCVTIDFLNLLPKKSWGKKIEENWEGGEKAAEIKLKTFIKEGIEGYRVGRDLPSENHTSHLSPYLHFGEISPAQIIEKLDGVRQGEDKDFFISELMWREFSTYLLYFFPSLEEKNFNAQFNGYPWKKNSAFLKAWQEGKTGYPFIDAAMRELWETGYMHNRARMVVASFLVKNLNIHWHHGRDWFWNCLVDADLANNSASWQWVAGCGVDAAPFFRIFNPVTQGEKFDAEGQYVKKWIKELKNLSPKYIHKPWTAPIDILDAAGIELGKTYPYPIIELGSSRISALKLYTSL
jgi:deoxyribodipyrimidine photo-lyase